MNSKESLQALRITDALGNTVTPDEKLLGEELKFPAIHYDIEHQLISSSSSAVKNGHIPRDDAETRLVDVHRNRFTSNFKEESRQVHARQTAIEKKLDVIDVEEQTLQESLDKVLEGEYKQVEQPGGSWTPIAMTKVAMFATLYVAILSWGFFVNKAFLSQQLAFLNDSTGATIAAVFALFIGFAPKFLHDSIDNAHIRLKLRLGFTIVAIIGAITWYLASGVQAGIDNQAAQQGLLSAAASDSSNGVMATAVPILRFLAQGLLEMSLGAISLIFLFETWELAGTNPLATKWQDNPRYVELSAKLAKLRDIRQALQSELKAIAVWFEAQEEKLRARLGEVQSKFVDQL